MSGSIEGPVLIVVGDDVSTGDMAPDGIGMSLWANIPECAEYMFERLDPDFPERARAAGGGVVVGGENYGQGSSREQAALSALHLGVVAVIARSFARIHRSNLIAQSVLPLLFADGDDHETVRRDEQWTIAGVAEAVRSGATSLTATRTHGRDIDLRLDLTPREREILMAGGTRDLLRGGGR